MSDTVIQVENLWKEYRLGVINHHTLTRDLQSWWARLRGHEDPNLQIESTSIRQIHPQPEDRFWALRDISFEVKQGDILGIIGRNGAGKSTLLKILSQVTAPTKGEVRYKGRIASLLEVGTGFHPELTGRENVFLNGAILGMSKSDIRKKLDEIIAFAEVETFIDTPVKRYSSGMYVRLAFAVAAHLEPEILVVDEVLAVGDAAFQKKCLGKMEEVGSQGRTVLFVSHNMGTIKYLCSSAMLLDKGLVVSTGKPEPIITRYLEAAEPDCMVPCLETAGERSGNGSVIFSEFFVEDTYGTRVKSILAGEDVVFVFRIKAQHSNPGNIDIGFSLHNQMGDPLSVLYSSYQNAAFRIDVPGYHTIRCTMEGLPFSPGPLTIKGRLLVNGEEADWPKVPLGRLHIENGNFYGTGNRGFSGNTSILVKGLWKHDD